MKNFMNYDFNIKKIVLSCLVLAGTGDAIHRNRPSHGLAYNVSGEMLYHFSTGEEITVLANEIIYLPKNSNYKVTSISDSDCYAINFDIDDDILFSPFVVKTKDSGTILNHFKTANNVWTSKKKSYTIKCMAELYNIIYAMHNEYLLEYLPKNKYEMIKPAVDYIHEKYTETNLSIAYLSEMCNITPEYFRKIFKNMYGISPIRYINNLKITRAKELLESQNYSVTEVATASGYVEMSHFSREFKKATGVCPSDFKKLLNPQYK